MDDIGESLAKSERLLCNLAFCMSITLGEDFRMLTYVYRVVANMSNQVSRVCDLNISYYLCSFRGNSPPSGA